MLPEPHQLLDWLDLLTAPKLKSAEPSGKVQLTIAQTLGSFATALQW